MYERFCRKGSKKRKEVCMKNFVQMKGKEVYKRNSVQKKVRKERKYVRGIFYKRK